MRSIWEVSTHIKNLLLFKLEGCAAFTQCVCLLSDFYSLLIKFVPDRLKSKVASPLWIWPVSSHRLSMMWPSPQSTMRDLDQPCSEMLSQVWICFLKESRLTLCDPGLHLIFYYSIHDIQIKGKCLHLEDRSFRSNFIKDWSKQERIWQDIIRD